MAVKVLRNGAERLLHVTVTVTVTGTAPGHLHFDSRPIARSPDRPIVRRR